MKNIIVSLGVAFLASQIHAEMFICSTNLTSSLIVASNEAIVISAARTTIDQTPDISGQITMGGKTNSLWMNSLITQPIAIAGPASLTFSSPVVITFKRLPGNIIHSIYLSDGDTNQQSITIPEGQTCRLFYPVGPNENGWSPAAVTITSGFQTVSNIEVFGEEEISGPASVVPSFNPGYFDSGEACIMSYYFTQDAQVVPELGLQGPTGSFEIVVEKTVDFTNWAPVVIHSTSAVKSGFYRLSISR